MFNSTYMQEIVLQKCVHPNIVVKIKNKSFCKLPWHWTLLV